MRPIDALAIAVRTADEVVDGNSERLALDVPAGELDAGYAHLRDAAGHGAEVSVHIEVQLFDGFRVFADEQGLEVFYQPDQRAGGDAGPELAVSGNALVGANGGEQPRAAPAINHEDFYVGDFHGAVS